MATCQSIQGKDTMTKILVELPVDVLFLIFDRCDKQSLGRLCRVCKKLNHVLQSDSIWLRFTSDVLLIGSSSYGAKRQKTIMKERCRVASRWIEKQSVHESLLRNNTRLMPWMQYVNNKLWISSKNVIQCFEIQDHGRPREKRKHRVVLPTSHRSHDVTRFVVKDNTLVSGCRDGSLYMFDCISGQCQQSLHQLHDTDTQAVDFHGDCIITGSRDSSVKVIGKDAAFNRDCDPVRAVFQMRERIWSLSISPDGQSVTVGSSGCRGAIPLSVWDIHTQQMVHELGEYKHGAGVLDMKYEDVNTLLSCGYDTTLRMWDLRNGKCVCEWVEPYDATVYCLQTDHNVTMVTGTAQHAMVRLWDKRRPESVQEYFFGQKSPVFSVVFDSSRLYAALDLHIKCMDFSTYS